MDTDTRAKRLTLLILLSIGLAAFFPAATRLLAQPGGQQRVFVPVISSEDGGSGAAATPVAGGRVYGLLGRLGQQQGARFSYTLTTPAGALYGLAGETPAVEEQMATLARAAPVPFVKVWGEVTAGAPPLIVVSGLLPTEAPGAPPVPTGAVTGASIPVAIVKFDLVNLHSEPSESSARTGAVVRGQACDIVGRTPAVTWWLLDCADGQEGWIDVRLVTAQGSTAGVPIVTSAVGVATPAAPPTATPAVPSFKGWRMEMYANPYLSGDPVALADVSQIDFDWGLGAPAPALPVDGFSLRLERRMTFSPAFYRITAEADDGVRVWVDDQLMIDQWHGSTNQIYTTGLNLSGTHALRVEYYEASGLASLRVRFDAQSDALAWDATYYGGTTPGGAALLQRREPRGQLPLDYNWGAGSPAPGQVGVDFWSARWTGQFVFDGGNYVFRVRADDGVRVWLDGQMVIDQWRDGYKQAQNRFIGVGRGTHTVTVEYYERSGLAQVTVWWTRE
ncbi:MAG: hypothetical protein DCC57_13330 [Chloroflexi bacterium]|nr:MAG: hypothetical protein DCC57_13330 [Chloroflexota bacterium]